jgi:hypothetical protein
MDNTEPKSHPALEAQFPTARPPPSHISDVKTPIPGWPSLANLIAQNPELEAFPSFLDLAIKSLLYYQAELIHLRKELHRSECVDLYEGDSNATYFAQNLSYLIAARDAAIENSTELPQQWILMEKIRITLEKYSQLFHEHSSKHH